MIGVFIDAFYHIREHVQSYHSGRRQPSAREVQNMLVELDGTNKHIRIRRTFNPNLGRYDLLIAARPNFHESSIMSDRGGGVPSASDRNGGAHPISSFGISSRCNRENEVNIRVGESSNYAELESPVLYVLDS